MDPSNLSDKDVAAGLNDSDLAECIEPRTPHSGKLRLRRVDSLDVESNNVTGMANHGQKALTKAVIFQLAYQSIGVVYGDVGTSPLYVFSSTFTKGIKQTDDVLGALSLIIYTLALVPLIKYVLIVLYANDNGEGGTFALYTLISRHAKVAFLQNQQVEDQDVSNYKLQTPTTKLERAMRVKRALESSLVARTILLILALLGTSLVIGDGVLTPAISVLSAVSGIQQATSKLKQDHVVLISVIVLVALFSVQRFGTSKVGFTFAPAVLTWFSMIGGIGIYNIVKHDPGVFRALNPKYIYDYFHRNKKEGWVSLGGVVLAITGTEAMFADVGHFSVPSIQIAFTTVVYPCLALAYTGQAAYLTKHPSDVGEAFYKSIPSSIYWPMFAVAVSAAFIASQAMISATFTIVKQSMSLGCFPRVKLIHTSSAVAGQIYIPEINWALMCACVVVTVAFRDTTKLGNAYGIAVVGVMLVTTCLVTLIMIMIWQLRLIYVLGFLLVFGSIDLLYLSSVLYKFDQGGYMPLLFAAILMFVMTVWYYVSGKRYGYELVNKVSHDSLENLVASVSRVPGISLVYTELVQGVPCIFAHMVENLPALHGLIVFVSVKFLPVTTILEDERFLVRRVGPRNYHIFRCVARYGYKDLRETNDVFQRHLLAKLANFITCESSERALDPVVQSSPASNSATKEGSLTGSCETQRSGRLSSSSIPQVEEVESKQSDEIRLSSDSINGRVLSRMSSTNQEMAMVQEELRFLQEARDAGVVYLLGHSDVKASSDSPLLKRFIVNYAYEFLRRNFRSGMDALIVPQQKTLEVGMIYYI